VDEHGGGDRSPPPGRDEARPRYGALIARIDGWAARARILHGERMQCREGCDGCCRRHLTVVPLEAQALAAAALALGNGERRGLDEHLGSWDERFGDGVVEAPCPLLREGRCLLYAARPLICRTHGFPLRTRPSGDPDAEEPSSLVWCELNFGDADARPPDERGVLDIDRVNRALGAVQELARRGGSTRRVPIRDALEAVRPVVRS